MFLIDARNLIVVGNLAGWIGGKVAGIGGDGSDYCSNGSNLGDFFFLHIFGMNSTFQPSL